MGEIFQKVALDRAFILDPREFFTRQLDFEDWTELRMGMFFSLVKSGVGNENVIAEQESVTNITNEDIITIGLKNSDNDNLPGFSGALFLGVTNHYDGVSELTRDFAFTNVCWAASQSGFLTVAGRYDTTLIGATPSEAVNNLECGITVANSTAYCGFFAIKFVILNRGLSTQSVKMSTAKLGAVSGADYTPSALRTLINNSTYGTERTIAWNDGAAARVIPDSFWIRLPFYNNRLRLSCIRAIRYAP